MKKRKKIEKRSSFLKTVFCLLFFLLAFSFLGANLFFSQNINPLFLKVLNHDYQAVVSYLKRIKKTPDFSSELKKFKQIYGKKIVNDVFSDDVKRRKKIKELEMVLKTNPDSRDILYNLYLLYKEDGDQKKAKKYIQRAKEIDPEI